MALLMCVACNCHVRAGERECPHCNADLSAAGTIRRPRRRAIEVRRVLVATALAGLGANGCGGRVLNEDVQGSCAGPAASSASGAVARCDSNCACGSGGTCKAGACVSCSCSADQFCDGTGTCQSSQGSPYWFEGRLPSTHSCYGSPPLLGAGA